MLTSSYTKLSPPPQRWEQGPRSYAFGSTVRLAGREIDAPAARMAVGVLCEDLRYLLKRPVEMTDDASAADILLVRRRADEDAGETLHPEGYSLSVTPRKIRLVAEGERGLFYGGQTLAQLAAMGRDRGTVRECRILDWPHYGRRRVMLDLGRAVFSMEYLKRLVRVLARLKFNGLHLHLHDNELNAVVYDGLPLGRENPGAHPISAFAELIAYARSYHVDIVPQLESWGHAGSLLQHAPYLYGATRRHGYGHSFAVGPQLLRFLEPLYDQWIAILPDGSDFMALVDEANWRRAPDADPRLYNRAGLVALYYRLAQDRAKARGKSIQFMTCGGGPKNPDLPMDPDLRSRIILMPWAYHSSEDVRGQLERNWVRDYKMHLPDGRLRAPFICGAGVGEVHEFGALHATTEWAFQARDWPNCLGISVMVWGTNDIPGRLVGLYHGADAAWNPVRAQEGVASSLYELYARGWTHGRIGEGALPCEKQEATLGRIAAQMKHWQAAFPDAHADALIRDRGPEVIHGCYRIPERWAEPYAPVWTPQEPFLGDGPE